MSAAKSDDNKYERRAFPRKKARCALHYFTQDGGSWSDAILSDYSAGGVCFYSDETLSQDTKITIQIMKNADISVPAMAASAVVVRCEQEDDHLFKVACRLTRVRDEYSRKPDYLRR